MSKKKANKRPIEFNHKFRFKTEFGEVRGEALCKVSDLKTSKYKDKLSVNISMDVKKCLLVLPAAGLFDLKLAQAAANEEERANKKAEEKLEEDNNG